MIQIPSPLSHAYILTGGTAAARADCARRLAQAYLCEGDKPPCGACRHCRKVASGIHPDMMLLSPLEGKRDIVVAQARALRSDAYIRPNEAGRKVYLIDPADAMNPEAQNALLKVLEDGPAYAAFLLLTAQPGALLETVRSRCEILTLPPAGEEAATPQIRTQAETLLRLVASGDELALAAECVALEKWERADLAALLGELTGLVRDALVIQAGGSAAPPDCAAAQAARALSGQALLSTAQLCRRLCAACEVNVGTGHAAGWLCAALINARG